MQIKLLEKIIEEIHYDSLSCTIVTFYLIEIFKCYEKYEDFYFPSIIFFKTFLNFITESELEFFNALKILFF